MVSKFESHLTKLLDDVNNALQDPDAFPKEKITNLAAELLAALTNGNRVALVGNGGSAAEAMHIAAEFTGKCVLEHRPLDVICLNESQSALTAIANDYGVEYIFSRQVEAHLRENDILIGLSTSGRSANILKAVETAQKIGVKTILWTGFSAPEIPGSTIWRAPSNSTPRAQEIHLIWGHLLAELVESQL